MSSKDEKAFAGASEAIARQLARDGAQRTSAVKDWATAQGVNADEWFRWAVDAGLIEQIYGDGEGDPAARWAVSVERALSYALEHARNS